MQPIPNFLSLKFIKNKETYLQMILEERPTATFFLKYLSAIMIPWIILAIIFGLYDLQISQAFVNFNSWWGKFGADFGEAPGYALIGISLGILFGGSIKRVKLQKIPSFILSAISLGVMIYGVIDANNKMAIISAFLSFPPAIFAGVTFSRDWCPYRKLAGAVILLAVINPLIFVQFLKYLWGRVRFRDLSADFSNFTPWYLPVGPKSPHSSFPSGHTAMGWMLLPLLFLVKDRTFKDPKRIGTIVAVFFWGVFVAISRVRIGAHYASDVLFSTGLAFLVTIFLQYFFYLWKRKKTISEKEETNDNST
ncbi:MAG: phosphatase PAP2 family protein [Candidatus Heimdallarchaeota archaeon]